MNICIREGCGHAEADHGYGCLLRECACQRFLPKLDDVGKLVAERDEAVKMLRMLDGLVGGFHEEDCPAHLDNCGQGRDAEDDGPVCDCAWKELNERVNAACRIEVSQ